MCHLLTWYWHTRCQQKHSSLLQQPTKASKCQGCERELSSDEFCCPTTDQVPDGAAYRPRTIQTTYLETPYVIVFYFHPLSDCFCLWFCCYDIINMCCVSLKGLKWAFTPTSKYKNKHGSGEIFPVFWYCFVGWGDLHPVPGTCGLSCDPLLLAPLHCY